MKERKPMKFKKVSADPNIKAKMSKAKKESPMLDQRYKKLKKEQR
jgi:hypothetical protein